MSNEDKVRDGEGTRQSLDNYLKELSGSQKPAATVIPVEPTLSADEEPGQSKEKWWSFQRFKKAFGKKREKEAQAKPKPNRILPEEGYDRLDEEKAKKRPWWRGPIGCVAGLATISCCVLGTTAILIPTMQRLLGISFGVDMEKFKQASDVNKQGQKITEDLIKEAQKEGTDFGENFEMKAAKEKGADFVEKTYKDVIRLFNKDTSTNVDPFFTSILMQPPLAFEPGSKLTDFNRVFNQENWSIAQKLYMESILIAAQEQGIDPNGGGLERWLVTNNGKDSVYKYKDVNGQKISVSGAHLFQLLWNEYQSGDSLPISAQDQQLFLQYWQASGRKWLTPEGKIETKHKMSWADGQAIFDMASQSGANPEEVLGNILTLQAELTTSQAGAEAKALDMAQATAGVASIDSISGALMGIMVVFGIGRPRLWNLIYQAGATVNQQLEIVNQEGQAVLAKIKAKLARPEISEEQRRLENSRRLVNRLRHDLSLSREVMQDVGAMLVNPNNQDMRDLLETEGVNWFRHVPETHPEIKQILGFFGCQNFQQLQELGQHPEQIVDRLHEVFQTGRRTSHKTQNRQILDLISLYYQASRKVSPQQ